MLIILIFLIFTISIKFFNNLFKIIQSIKVNNTAILLQS